MIRKRFRKRYVVFGLVALEIASIPVAAQMVDRVSFEVEPRVIVAEIPDRPAGERSFLVATNDGFVVEVEGVIGSVTTEVTASGHLGGVAYGSAAMMPGASSACTAAFGGRTQVYNAPEKTADTRGRIQDQAVRIDVRFDPLATPDIEFVPTADATGLPGQGCGLS